MQLLINGLPADSNDKLARAVIISLFTWRRARVRTINMTDRNTAGGVIPLPSRRMIASGQNSISF